MTLTADQAMTPAKKAPGPKPDGREEAEQYLRQALANGSRPAKDLIDEAVHRHGISKPTLDRAKKSLGIDPHRETIPGPWFWRLPQDHQVAPNTPEPEDLDNLAELSGKQGFLGGLDPMNSKVLKFPDGYSDDEPPPAVYDRIAAQEDPDPWAWCAERDRNGETAVDRAARYRREAEAVHG